MTKKFSFLTAAAFFVAAFGMLFTQQATAADFSGKRIRIIVPFSEGGGTDSLTRFLQPFYEKHLPGNPKILVVNKPGAGGIVGGNYFHSRAKKNGTWVMALSTSTVMNYVLRDPRVKFDILEWQPIVLLPRGNMIYVRGNLGIHKIKSLKGKVAALRKHGKKNNVVFGGKTPTSSAINKRIGLESLGIKVKNVWGMKGNGPMALAFERGEFTINFDNAMSYTNNRKQLRKNGIAHELYTHGAPDANGNWGRDPLWPNVPTIYEFYEAVHGKKVSGPMGNALDALVVLGTAANKSFHLPKGTPKAVVEAWRKATRNVMKDPKFKKKAGKIIGPYSATIGAPAAKIIREKLKLPTGAKKYIEKFLKEQYGLTMNLS
jgi:tripartite-type tricarboxylate transporter receptor subunit TctC